MKKIILVLFIGILLFANINIINSQPSQEGELKVTLEHPFLINDEWIKASELQEGDLLTTIDGKKAIITSIEKVEVEEGVEVYNLEDDFGINNYVVGDEGVVVHNSGLRINPKIYGYGTVTDGKTTLKVVYAEIPQKGYMKAKGLASIAKGNTDHAKGFYHDFVQAVGKKTGINPLKEDFIVLDGGLRQRLSSRDFITFYHEMSHISRTASESAARVIAPCRLVRGDSLKTVTLNLVDGSVISKTVSPSFVQRISGGFKLVAVGPLEHTAASFQYGISSGKPFIYFMKTSGELDLSVGSLVGTAYIGGYSYFVFGSILDTATSRVEEPKNKTNKNK